jgi:hypothetical protein
VIPFLAWVGPGLLVASLVAGVPVLPVVVATLWLLTGHPWPPALGLSLLAGSVAVEWALIRWRRGQRAFYPLRRLGTEVAALVALGITLGPWPGAALFAGALGADTIARLPQALRGLRQVALVRAVRVGLGILIWYGVGR